MRKKLSILNSMFGIINRIVILFFSFLVRLVFTRYLCAELLGFEGLFSNILGLLSLVDMGLGTAISFSLYQPIHDKQRNMVSAIMKLYRKIYIFLGILIFLLSLMLTPFLQYFLKDVTLDIDYIRIAFIIYSAGVAVSYFFAYKRTIIFAVQKNYIVLVVDTIVKMITSLLQIILLIYTRNYLLYLSILLFNNLIANIIISHLCDRKNLYDFNSKYVLPKSYKKDLLYKIRDISISQICGKGITSTDNILISSFVGVVDLAKNSNYSLILLGIQSLVTIVINGFTASIGDLMAENDKNKIRFYFMLISFTYFLMSAYCSISFYFLVNPFISLWVGPQYLFPDTTKLLLTLNLYFFMIQQPVLTYQALGGLFAYFRKYSISQVLINLILSIILGKLFGIIGIFAGSFVCYIYAWIMQTNCIYDNLLSISSKRYWYEQTKYICITCICFIISFILICPLQIEGALSFIVNGIIVSIVFLFVVIITLRRNKYYKYILDFIFRFGKNRNRKV